MGNGWLEQTVRYIKMPIDLTMGEKLANTSPPWLIAKAYPAQCSP